MKISKAFKNPCIRCGTERIVLKTWKEKIGSSVIVNKEMICPNPECQKKVNADNKKQDDRREEMKLRSEQRALNRKATRNSKRVKNR